MVYKAVIHGFCDPVRKKTIFKAIAQFRVDKAVKYLKESGVTDDAIRVCIEQELVHRREAKALNETTGS